MTQEVIFTNANVITPQGTIHGTVVVNDDVITHIDEGRSNVGATCECTGSLVRDAQGDYLIPGLIEMHTDHLETQFQPRPGVLWPSSLAALVAHDTQVVGGGITTVLDSICCGQLNEGKMRHTLLDMSISAIRDARQKNVLRADHQLHLRCEICDPHVMEMFEPYVDEENLRLVSLMDHTPGQRQFCDYNKYREYYKCLDWSDEQFQRLVSQLKDEQETNAAKNRSILLAMCHRRNIPIASHDDTTIEHVEEAVREGLTISEFPTTLEAARKAREEGLGIVMGAPNVVRGGSHSGNVSARDLAAEGLLDILSSDYVPASLLHGAFMLHDTLDIPLHEALATVTSNPARLLKLEDRGELVVGKRADIARVKTVDSVPVVRSVWRGGKRLL
ncbi:alpha-D-ribose 1-methylphosphonate 5-triphosphate diphosphatase [Halodesulfovibrio sp.]|uniref:alpha-D-ribose 1-methylphosphonate 5-triphosphate diphosphatase n=1 Tax=Halodesulfovibrio sp. TaxID=1912772 RepID=UPI0025BA35A5|nr:alpha-D-ribose 1-methylphosphonate 5-triphosphate diphosphatase [Halodesulfovibrio sp.]